MEINIIIAPIATRSKRNETFGCFPHFLVLCLDCYLLRIICKQFPRRFRLLVLLLWLLHQVRHSVNETAERH